MNSHDIDELILAAICVLPFILAGTWAAVALLRGGKVGEE